MRAIVSEGIGTGLLVAGVCFIVPATLIVLALIAIAVGDELAIAHPGDDATLGFTLLTFGGPALFLLAQVFFLRETLGHVPRSRPVSVAALAKGHCSGNTRGTGRYASGTGKEFARICIRGQTRKTSRRERSSCTTSRKIQRRRRTWRRSIPKPIAARA